MYNNRKNNFSRLRFRTGHELHPEPYNFFLKPFTVGRVIVGTLIENNINSHKRDTIFIMHWCRTSRQQGSWIQAIIGPVEPFKTSFEYSITENVQLCFLCGWINKEIFRVDHTLCDLVHSVWTVNYSQWPCKRTKPMVLKHCHIRSSQVQFPFVLSFIVKLARSSSSQRRWANHKGKETGRSWAMKFLISNFSELFVTLVIAVTRMNSL